MTRMMTQERIQNIYVVSKYTRPKREISIMQNFYLYSTEFHSLKPGKDIDGEVINACATIDEKEWKNAVFISTNETFTLFRDNWKFIPDDNWLLFKMNFPSSGKMFLPYLKASHWRLFLIDIDKKIMSIIDPLVSNPNILSSEWQRIKSHMARFVELCRKKRSKTY